MIGRCMRLDSEFGVATITEGQEVGRARTASIGTTARICDFETLSGGLLGLMARGGQRFKIESVATQGDGLNIADVELLAVELAVPIPPEYDALPDLLRKMYPQISSLYGAASPHFEEAGWVSARLAELLPLSLPERQHCLELDDPLARLAYVQAWVEARSG